MKSTRNKVIRGRFRSGESVFPSSKDKREKIMHKVEGIKREVERLNAETRSKKK